MHGISLFSVRVFPPFTSLCMCSKYVQGLNNLTAMRRRTLKYIIPTFLLSLLFNFPKFFEAKILEREFRVVHPAQDEDSAMAPADGSNGTIATDGTTTTDNFTRVIKQHYNIISIH